MDWCYLLGKVFVTTIKGHGHNSCLHLVNLEQALVGHCLLAFRMLCHLYIQQYLEWYLETDEEMKTP